MFLQDNTPLKDLPNQLIAKYAGESQLGLYVRGTSVLTDGQTNSFYSTAGFGWISVADTRLLSYDVSGFYLYLHYSGSFIRTRMLELCLDT